LSSVLFTALFNRTLHLQLEYDILQYIVIERLAQGGRAKLKDDGLNLSDWLQCLASFWGHLYVPFDSGTVFTFWYPMFILLIALDYSFQIHYIC
jgi:hypothetical protein